MTSANPHLLRLLIATLLLAAVVLTAAAELLAERCESGCQDECDDACEHCGDCIDCQRTMPMLVDAASDNHAEPDGHSWFLPWASVSAHALLHGGIDHPPQLS